jgi:hypothetical protein
MPDSENDARVHRLCLILTALVDHPAELTITTDEDRDGVLFVIRAHADDVGKVIGALGPDCQVAAHNHRGYWIEAPQTVCLGH